MDSSDPVQPKRRRFSTEGAELSVQQTHHSASALLKQFRDQLTINRSKSHRLCNELVWEVCKDISVVKTADHILLTASNIHAYLGKRFRKKVIYSDVIAFIKAKLNKKKKADTIRILIVIDEVAQNNEGDLAVIHQRQQSANAFELQIQTNQFRVRMRKSWHRTRLIIIGGYYVNAHVLYFVHLVVPLIAQIQMDFPACGTASVTGTVIRILNTLHQCLDLVSINPKHFLSPPISAALAKCNKVEIDCRVVLSDDQLRQFRFELIRWLSTSNNGQPKLRKCQINHITDRRLETLLDELKTEFLHATSKSPFTLSFWPRYRVYLDLFIVRNNVGEELKLQRKYLDTINYILIRRSVPKAKDFDCEKKMEIHPIPAKRPRISAEESTVDQQQQAEMDEASPKSVGFAMNWKFQRPF